MGANLLKVLIVQAGPKLAAILVPILFKRLQRLVESTPNEIDDICLDIALESLQKLTNDEPGG